MMISPHSFRYRILKTFCGCVLVGFATVAPCLLLAQAPADAKDTSPAATGPLVADIHAAPYRGVIYYRMNLGHQRFNMHDASVLDLIAFAYDRNDPDSIVGGPTWIDLDRFDITVSVPTMPPNPRPDPSAVAAPPPNPYDPVRPFLQRALVERFNMKYHTEQRPLPGYIMTVAKDGAKLTEAKDPTAPPNCHGEQDKAVPGQQIVTCSSQTITQLLKTFGGIYSHPIIDHTGLTKTYDFTFTLNFASIRSRDAYVRMFTDIFNKQFGLVVTAGDVPQPAMLIDSVDRPTPNSPDIAKLIPPLPDLEFEVATIKPVPDELKPKQQGMVMPRGSQITFGNMSLQDLIVRAWQLKTGAMIANAPAFIGPTRYDILVKLPPDINANAVWQNEDQVDTMLQKLLVDRFQIKYHWGEQTQDGFVLLGGTPKMKPADPKSRSFCKYGAPPGEKDVRSSPDSPYDNESYCQNVTMDQFADMIQAVCGSEVKNRVANKTGLAGAYDFTIYYSSGRKLRADAAAADAAAKQAGDATAAPAGGLSVQDAFKKELGLQLVRQPGTYPALLMDHIEQTPTDN